MDKESALVGLRFRVDGGDSQDPRYFRTPMILRVVSEPWFSGDFPQGKSIFLRAETGDFEGEYFAATSKIISPIPDQLKTSNWLSVVIYKIHKTGSGFDPKNPNDAYAFGMCAMELVNPV